MEPIKISLEMHGKKYTVEGLAWDSSAEDLIEMFTKLLVVAGFSPSVIIPKGGGKYVCDYDADA